MRVDARRPSVQPIRLDVAARLVDAVASRHDEERRAVLRTVAGRLHGLAARWDAIHQDGSDGADRWEDAPALADLCVALIEIAAQLRQRARWERRARVADRLRDAARYLSTVEPARDELRLLALDLSWAAGMLPPIAPPSAIDVDAVIGVLVQGVVVAATVADPAPPMVRVPRPAAERPC